MKNETANPIKEERRMSITRQIELRAYEIVDNIGCGHGEDTPLCQPDKDRASDDIIAALLEAFEAGKAVRR